ncbi:MAG: ECF-type sigma factor [Rudaea sp.]|uniref:ECF-type sigma factor n=1 Tax=Rudaea sp. TaxID=2136325 RepID=UPI0039E5D6D1
MALSVMISAMNGDAIMTRAKLTDDWGAQFPPADLALADQLFPLFYEQLRSAGHRERLAAGDTLRTTALVNEAYLRLRRGRGWSSDAHFLRAAALPLTDALDVAVAESARS